MRRTAILALAVVASSAFAIKAETIEPVRAAVFRSTGTQFLGMTIWRELNAGWSDFGDVPVEIDWSSLAGYDITDAQLEATGADVIVLSNPGFLTYTAAEIAALRRYVEAGHGLIISYGKFRSEDRALAPLVGLSSRIRLGTGTFSNGISFEIADPRNPLFAQVSDPYQTGVQYMAVPATDGLTWEIDGGTIFAEALAPSGTIVARGVVLGHDSDAYRGLYFSHYLEAQSGGTNHEDMQVFYNGLLWAAAPEPASVLLVTIGSLLVARRRPMR